MTLFYKAIFATLASLLALCTISLSANAAPFQRAVVDNSEAASSAHIVKVHRKYKRRRYSRRARKHHRRYRNRHVDAPYTYVDGYRGDVEVDAPYAYVRRSYRGVRVRAPFVDIYIPR